MMTLWILFLIGAHATHANEPLESPPIALGLGEQRLLTLEAESRFSLSGECMRAIQIPDAASKSRTRILLKAVKMGSGELTIVSDTQPPRRHTLSVLEGPSSSPTLLRALSALRELQVIAVGDWFHLTGQASTRAELLRASLALRQFPKQISEAIEFSGELEDSIRQKLEGFRNEFPNLEWAFRQGRLFVSGSVTDQHAAERAEKEIRNITPILDWGATHLSQNGRTFFLRVFILELHSTGFSSLGLSWKSPFSAFSVVESSLKNVFEFEAMIRMLAGRGELRILSRPELTLNVPGEAEMSSGSELPIRVQTRFQSHVQWKQLGLILKLKALEATSQIVRLQLQAEMSRIAPELTNDQIPGVRNNKMKTDVDAQLGEPLVLAGLRQDSRKEQDSGLPLLHGLPLIGNIFGARESETFENELLVVLLPHRSSPRADLTPWSEPRGPSPPPRNWIDPRERSEMERSEEFPWNAL